VTHAPKVPKAKTGADYVATTKLTTLANETIADVGQTCERMDPRSIEPLLERGWIVLKGKE
jgi:hypothetical protein